MSRLAIASMLLSLAAATGCRMCAHPYDYCGPIVSQGCHGMQCHETYRAGSILSEAGPMEGAPIPMDAPILDAPAAPASAEPAMDYSYSGPQPRVNLPASGGRRARVSDPAFANDPEIAGGVILSITDRKVEDGSQVADTAPSTRPQSSPAGASSGSWVARRASRTTIR